MRGLPRGVRELPEKRRALWYRCRHANRFGVTTDLEPALFLGLGRAQVDALFTASGPGRIPNGLADGTALIAPGSSFNFVIARAVKLFVWQGKAFDAKRGVLTNRISPIGLHAVVAEVYEGTSWFDRKPCIVLDYSRTSRIAHWVRDEIREVQPGVYLGIAFWARWRLTRFCLTFARQIADEPVAK